MPHRALDMRGAGSMMEEVAEKMWGIWDELGISEEEQEERIKTAIGHTRALWQDMLNEETNMRQELLGQKEELVEEIKDFCHQLCLNHTKKLKERVVEDRLLPQIRSLKALRGELQVEAEERLKVMAELEQEEQELQTKLGHGPFSREASDDRLLSEAQCEAWTAHIRQHQSLYSNRSTAARKAAERITELGDLMKKETPRRGIEAKLMAWTKDEATLTLTEETMRKIQDLVQKLEEDFETFKEAKNRAYLDKRDELLAMLEKCQAGPEKAAEILSGEKELYDSEDVATVDFALAEWGIYFEARKGVLDKLSLWEQLWQERLDLQAQEKHPDWYKNRNGLMTKTLKRLEQIDKRDLPKCESELSALVALWESEHPGESISTNGMSPLEKIQSVREEAEALKAMSKTAAKENRLGSKFGSTASLAGTPARTPARTAARTPARTPARSSARKAHGTFARAANAGHDISSTPSVATKTGLIITTPSHSTSRLPRSTRKMPHPDRDPLKNSPMYGKRQATSVLSLHQASSPAFAAPEARRVEAPKGAEDLTTARRRSLRSHHIDETIGEHEFRSGDFHNSTLAGRQ